MTAPPAPSGGLLGAQRHVERHVRGVHVNKCATHTNNGPHVCIRAGLGCFGSLGENAHVRRHCASCFGNLRLSQTKNGAEENVIELTFAAGEVSRIDSGGFLFARGSSCSKNFGGIVTYINVLRLLLACEIATFAYNVWGNSVLFMFFH